jgi:hypothetical protein
MKIHNNKIVAEVLTLTALVLNLSAIQPAQAQTGSSTYTGSTSNSIVLQSAMLLTSGKVLIIGGEATANDTFMPNPELYDPATGIWKITPLSTKRAYTYLVGYTLTTLTNGKVLIAGGYDGNNSMPNADLFDPASETWTNTGPLNIARSGHTATLLPNGKVLITGGQASDGTPLSVTEIYDPATGLWTTNGNLLSARFFHTATLLANGKVLVAGGYGDINGTILSSAEIYDPGTGTATAIVLNNVAKLSSGAFQIGFSNAPGANFTALATTNLSLPASNWTILGSIPEISSGQYQFTDSQATNKPQRFYRVSSP